MPRLASPRGAFACLHRLPKRCSHRAPHHALMSPRMPLFRFAQAMPASGYAGAQFMEMLEADLERANKFVALQVEDLKLRSRALGARAAAAATPAELDRIEGASYVARRDCARTVRLMHRARAHIPWLCSGGG